MRATSVRFTIRSGLVALVLIVTACGGSRTPGDTSALSGSVVVDGSSTVYPVTEAVAEEFRAVEAPRVRVTVGISGTGGGFKRFCSGETDVSNASRPIKDEEAEACRDRGIDYIELPVAIDALAVVVNRNNDWIADDCITVDQLNAAWDEESNVQRWSDLDSEWPAEPISFYAPGHDSGTFDYFTEVINGASQRSRTDNVMFSEDDNVLVQGVAGDRSSLGYFGFAYFQENRDTIKALKINSGSGCVEPTVANVEADRYQPLARPIYIYVKQASLSRDEVRSFVQFYMDNVNELAADVGYMPLPAGLSEETTQTLDEALSAAR